LKDLCHVRKFLFLPDGAGDLASIPHFGAGAHGGSRNVEVAVHGDETGTGYEVAGIALSRPHLGIV